MLDYILVGGGLQSALILLALRAHRPEARIALVERNVRLGGNHTWCFHRADLQGSSRNWIEPLVVAHWPGYDVRFPDGHQRVDGDYAAISSERLHDCIVSLLEPGTELFLQTTVNTIAHDRVLFDNGSELRARVVIDARGPMQTKTANNTGYQKFFGVEFRTTSANVFAVPMLMDARVPQTDGFRFFYVLPLADDRVLIEETFFADAPELDVEQSRQQIMAYAQDAGLEVVEVLREEQGVLPMPWRGEFPPPDNGPLTAGYRGGFFHPATGYSLPVAARLAELIATRSPQDLFTDGALHAFWRHHQRQAAFCHRLNAMLFQWFAPQNRWHIYSRFYRLPQETIDRFYALQLRAIDQGRLLLGRPPRGFSFRYRLSRGVAS